MKTLTKNILIVLCITLLSSAQLFGQEWSDEQKEVWKNVEAYYALWEQGDLEGFLSYVHEDYLGWPPQYPFPRDKTSVRKWTTYSWPKMKVLVYEIKPAAIGIYGNVAIVHYYYDTLVKDSTEKENREKGRWTDILMKQGDKWVMIGDCGEPSATN
jgi:ketosteroid isomerase-like protein